MKTKTILITALAIMGLVLSCSSDYDFPNEKANDKTSLGFEMTPIENFRMAINEINQPNYFPSPEYTKKHGDELSAERKAILFDPALELIYSNGDTKEKPTVRTISDTNRILNQAFKIYISKTAKK